MRGDSNLDTCSDNMKPVLPGKREWLHESVGIRGADAGEVDIFLRGAHGRLDGGASGGRRDLILTNKQTSAVGIVLPCRSGTLTNASAC